MLKPCVLCGERFVRPAATADMTGKIASMFCVQCLQAIKTGRLDTRPQLERLDDGVRIVWKAKDA